MFIPSSVSREATAADFLKVGSVHDQPFPELDGTIQMLASSTQSCAVQINGKMKVSHCSYTVFLSLHF